ncbi:hypothetical protein [Psychromonas aquimarina]|uniref:hypothetical protein n=1 Tax=Psychromonas aquimarina TaxID=444919 RepID=UPI0003FBE790|nr:hypothetical protein [Psychromonas aquimarina]
MAKSKQVTAKKRKYSRPVITKTLEMHSEASILALDQYINRTMSSLYALDVILFYIGDDVVAETANEKVQDIFAEKIKLFNKDITKYSAIVEENDFERADYTMHKQKEFKIYSPLASMYLNMMGKFELVTNLIDTIWLNGEMVSRIRKDRVVKLGIHMRNVSQQINNIAKHAMQVAKNTGKSADAVETMKELEIDAEVVTNDAETATAKVKNPTKKAVKAVEVKPELSLTEMAALESTEKEVATA